MLTSERTRVSSNAVNLWSRHRQLFHRLRSFVWLTGSLLADAKGVRGSRSLCTLLDSLEDDNTNQFVQNVAFPRGLKPFVFVSAFSTVLIYRGRFSCSTLKWHFRFSYFLLFLGKVALESLYFWISFIFESEEIVQVNGRFEFLVLVHDKHGGFLSCDNHLRTRSTGSMLR